MKMMATNKNHAHLGKFVGEWNVTSKGWMMPGQEPQTSQNYAGEPLPPEEIERSFRAYQPIYSDRS